jgi:hypothetical protein
MSQLITKGLLSAKLLIKGFFGREVALAKETLYITGGRKLSLRYGGDGVTPTAVSILTEQQELNRQADRNRAGRNIAQCQYR